jgi:hypothetical protein
MFWNQGIRRSEANSERLFETIIKRLKGLCMGQAATFFIQPNCFLRSIRSARYFWLTFLHMVLLLQ